MAQHLVQVRLKAVVWVTVDAEDKAAARVRAERIVSDDANYFFSQCEDIFVDADMDGVVVAGEERK